MENRQLLLPLLEELNIFYDGACSRELAVAAVSDDSRRCDARTLFVAVPGTRVDGHDYLEEAARRGARAALICRRDVTPPPGMACLVVENPRRALSMIAQRLAGDPSRQMKVVAVTGTNGKTTVTYLMESIFRAARLKPGVIGTIQYRWGSHVEAAPQTTPPPAFLAQCMADMQADGVQAVAMEVSSHAIDQYRVDGVKLDAAGFTNLTQDHLDYHNTMEEYGRAKERLFTEVLPMNSGGVAVLNLDDPAGRAFAESSRASKLIGVSLYRDAASLRVSQIQIYPDGMRIDVCYQGEGFSLRTPLRGFYNAQNCIVAAGLALAVGIDFSQIVAGCAALRCVPGRFEPVEAGQDFPIIVDYAHTPDSLLQTLLTARGLATRKLIAVFGCGGDRDPGKRPLMGQAAARLADHIIITNDNPRSEDPALIAEAIERGVRERAMTDVKYEICLDRKTAIERAIAIAKHEDAVIIAGKGHEDYQITGQARVHFDDREVARAAVTRR